MQIDHRGDSNGCAPAAANTGADRCSLSCDAGSAGPPSTTGNGRRPATPCTRTRRCWASWRSRWLPRSPSSSTRPCDSPRVAGRRSRCRRPTAPARSSPRSTCAPTRRSSSTPAGAPQRSPLTPDRPVGEVTGSCSRRVGGDGRPRRDQPVPQEVSWSVPAGRDTEHSRYDAEAVERYFAVATQAAARAGGLPGAPYRGRSTPVNAWWGSFDLAVNLFSGAPADPPSRRLHHAQRDGRRGGRGRLVAGRRPL